MGKHGNQDSNTKPEGKDTGYQPQHSGGQDGFEWAKTRPNTETTILPKTDKKEW